MTLPFVLEGIVTTLNADGSLNLAPMGPILPTSPREEIQRLLFRPFPDSVTGQNLLRTRQGVFHLTDDVLLFAQAVTKTIPVAELSLQPATYIAGSVLKNACRWLEFEIETVDESQQRLQMEARVVSSGHGREFLGFNRARHAVVEGAILVTRWHLLEKSDLQHQMAALKIILEKTGGPEEHQAWDLLQLFLEQKWQESSLSAAASTAGAKTGESL